MVISVVYLFMSSNLHSGLGGAIIINNMVIVRQLTMFGKEVPTEEILITIEYQSIHG